MLLTVLPSFRKRKEFECFISHVLATYDGSMISIEKIEKLFKNCKNCSDKQDELFEFISQLKGSKILIEKEGDLTYEVKNFPRLLNIIDFNISYFDEIKHSLKILQDKLLQQTIQPVVITAGNNKNLIKRGAIPTLEFILMLLREAEREIILINPFLDEKGFEHVLNVLNEKIKQNIKIKLLIRSQGTVSLLKKMFVSKRSLKVLEKNGFEIRVYNSEAGYLHAKIILVDSQKGYIGSANFLSSSFYSNFEVGVSLSTYQARILSNIVKELWEKYSTEVSLGDL